MIGREEGSVTMNMPIDPDMKELIDRKVESGQFESPSDVVRAALAALNQQECFGDFRTGELDGLLAEGERGIAAQGTLDADEALTARRTRRVSPHE
jgi:putative addiction module CopG family antidote